MKLKVLAVDDNHSKLTQLIIELRKSAGLNEDAPAESRIVGIAPEELQIVDGIEFGLVVEKVLSCDAAIVDYQLGSEANVDFTGVKVIDEVLRRHRHFPVFLLTSFRQAVFDNEVIDVCHVFDFDKYLEGGEYAQEMNRTILRQVQNHEREKRAWEDELNGLLVQKGGGCNVKKDERILDLDTWLEQTVAIRGFALTRKAKRELSESKLDALIAKADQLIASCK